MVTDDEEAGKPLLRPLEAKAKPNRLSAQIKMASRLKSKGSFARQGTTTFSRQGTTTFSKQDTTTTDDGSPALKRAECFREPGAPQTNTQKWVSVQVSLPHPFPDPCPDPDPGPS